MASATGIDTQHIKDTALKDLLDLLEGVRPVPSYLQRIRALLKPSSRFAARKYSS